MRVIAAATAAITLAGCTLAPSKEAARAVAAAAAWCRDDGDLSAAASVRAEAAGAHVRVRYRTGAVCRAAAGSVIVRGASRGEVYTSPRETATRSTNWVEREGAVCLGPLCLTGRQGVAWGFRLRAP